ncbi:MAG: hypothetical protein HY033_04565 [Ignavibacteriae bacterium]|nr:hypothetical protein [Ignavibacteria bacterium]MBI3364162.1 hypothetical protein [Ignavibacteriota bacterium]
MAKNMKADFCIEIDFQRGSESPSRVFRAMTDLIETFQEIDKTLIESIDAKIEPVAIIEDIEAGSLKAWLSTVLKAVDDEALKHIDWKPAVGKYLVRAKYIVVNFLKDKTEIVNRTEVEGLERDLLKSAEETDVTHFPAYAPVQRQRLLSNIEKLTVALSNLNENDKATYITTDKDVEMNARFHFVPENIEELMTQETITTPSEMVLKVKKPDYLGESQWEFRHGTHPIYAKFLDAEWLKNFQSRKYDVRPGDSLRVMVNINVKYGYDKEVVGIHHDITKVKEIIPLNPLDQLPLLTENK